MRKFNYSGLVLGLISASLVVSACANNSTQSTTVTTASMSSVKQITIPEGATVLPTQKPDADSYIGNAYSTKSTPVLKMSRFVPVENKVAGKVTVSTGDCETDAKGSFYCSQGSLMLVQDSSNNVRMPDGGSVVLTLSTDYDPWYQYTINYIKDGVLYPTPWYFNTLDQLNAGMGPRFARVNGDFCLYGEAFQKTKRLDTIYNCFKVNKSYKDEKGSAPILLLSDQTYKHNVKELTEKTANNTSIHSFNNVEIIDTEEYEHYGYN
ncbi:MAG: hypothetical protein VYA60_04370 [Pseudomonadota bacterium]|nr:hypothetical protein [Pseudomonadota bacterium]